MSAPRQTSKATRWFAGRTACGWLAPLMTLALLGSAALTRPTAVDVDAPRAPAADHDPLRGLWMRYDARGEGDPLRFWYFHGDGKGLYRYGKVGLANTHSFDYAVHDDGALDLRFRKRGEAHALVARIQREGGATWLSLIGDPYEPGARYRLVESELDLAAWARPPQPAEDPEHADAPAAIGDRIWIDYRNHATGGSEFHMYQLAATAIDGRGVGWFHRGDFDDWSTESLTYRLDGDHVELFFDLREEPAVTRFELVDGARGRELVLEADPRDFWARHAYADGGRSFGTSAFDAVIGLERLLSQRPMPRTQSHE